jgi:hypothetical protein
MIDALNPETIFSVPEGIISVLIDEVESEKACNPFQGLKKIFWVFDPADMKWRIIPE